MKKIFTLILMMAVAGMASAQLLSQNFNSSSTLSDYVDNTTPGTTKFNALSTSGAGTVVSINSNKLRYARTANAGAMSRSTDLSPVPTAVKVRFEFTLSGNSASATTAMTIQMGDTYGTANSSESNANTHSRFGVNISATTGEYSFRDLGASVNSSTLSGTQNVMWVINNSGASKNYLAPDGTTASVADDKYDLWAGTTLLFNDANAQTTTKTLADFKFSFSSGVATVDFDNFEIFEIDDPLPISLVKFTATKLAEKVKVQWATATEINNDKFIIERSVDGENFEYVAEVSGAGTSRELNSYEIVDAKPLKGTSYYRLTQTDFDGTSETFAPVAVSMEQGALSVEHIAGSVEQGAGSMGLRVYSPLATEATVSVRDLSGRSIYSEKINLQEGYQNFNLATTNFGAGIYLVSLNSGTEVVMKKVKI